MPGGHPISTRPSLASRLVSVPAKAIAADFVGQRTDGSRNSPTGSRTLGYSRRQCTCSTTDDTSCKTAYECFCHASGAATTAAATTTTTAAEADGAVKIGHLDFVNTRHCCLPFLLRIGRATLSAIAACRVFRPGGSIGWGKLNPFLTHFRPARIRIRTKPVSALSSARNNSQTCSGCQVHGPGETSLPAAPEARRGSASPTGTSHRAPWGRSRNRGLPA